MWVHRGFIALFAGPDASEYLLNLSPYDMKMLVRQKLAMLDHVLAFSRGMIGKWK